MKLTSLALNISSEGKTLVTKELQVLINRAKEEKKVCVISKGKYLTGPLFLPSDFTFEIDEGAEIIATDDENQYQKIPTRIAGIFMDGYPGIINVIEGKNVIIKGKGTLNGNGEYWYRKYWGEDEKGGMRAAYDKKGLRWACDYDCFRPRNILVQNSSDVKISGITLKDSPFWNLHILSSSHVKAEGLSIISDNPHSPSTDGIDVDSSSEVTIRKCLISTNDDCISLKSGRDKDGLDYKVPTAEVRIMDCTFKKGYGISIGSELSGGIQNIRGKNLVFEGTSCAFRIKSSYTRKGYVHDVKLEALKMKDVMYPFYCYLDWNPLYNKAELPSDYKGKVPSYYRKLMSYPSDNLPSTDVKNLEFTDIEVSYSPSYKGKSCLFTFKGFNDNPLKDIKFKNIKATVNEYGTFENCRKPEISSSAIKVTGKSHSIPGSFDNR